MRTSNEVFREMIHWLWLWMLTAIVLSVLQSVVLSNEPAPPRSADYLAAHARPKAGPSPSIEQADRSRSPLGITGKKNATLRDMLLLNQRGDYESVIEVWNQLDIAPDSVAWKHIGIGVAQLRLQNLDQAHEQFSRSVRVDPENAVGEYFLGRVCQAKSRATPYWHETKSESPFRLIVFNPNLTAEEVERGLDRGDAFLPHLRTGPFEKQAKTHYRRAVRFSSNCDLDRTIDFVVPRLRLINQLSEQKPVTARDLLISLDEENYDEKARLEVGERLIGIN